jgi:hypothetical protein
MHADPRSTVSNEFDLRRAFAPLHKRALGFAVAIASSTAVAAITLFHILFAPQAPVELLAQFFLGYSISWTGAVIGMAWAGAGGFLAGWFVAFVRNLTVDTWLLIVRTRSELGVAHDFLDQI